MTATPRVNIFGCVSGSAEKNYIIETTACTLLFSITDNDGKPDIFLLNGSTMKPNAVRKNRLNRVFRNTGN
jgi:hypothetical protein